MNTYSPSPSSSLETGAAPLPHEQQPSIEHDGAMYSDYADAVIKALQDPLLQQTDMRHYRKSHQHDSDAPVTLADDAVVVGLLRDPIDFIDRSVKELGEKTIHAIDPRKPIGYYDALLGTSPIKTVDTYNALVKEALYLFACKARVYGKTSKTGETELLPSERGFLDAREETMLHRALDTLTKSDALHTQQRILGTTAVQLIGIAEHKKAA